jgi:ribose transport system permease protein
MTETLTATPSRKKRTFQKPPDLALSFVLLIVIFVVGIIGIPNFGGVNTIKAVLLLGSFLGIAAAGQTLVVILGGIDLSIPFVVGAANVAVAKLFSAGLPFPVTVLVVLLLTAAFGALNALISVKSHVHPLIVTLGMGTALLGVISVWTNGLPTGGAPVGLAHFVAIGSTTGPIPLPPVVFLWIAIGVLVVIVLRATIFGRRLYALGNSPRAAELALVRPLPIWIGAFAISGVMSGVVGILYLGFTGSAFADVGQSYLFLTVGAVVLGGTLVTGGKGGYVGTAIGALIITLLSIVLTDFGLNSSVQQVVMGFVFVIFVAIYGRDAHVRARV